MHTQLACCLLSLGLLLLLPSATALPPKVGPYVVSRKTYEVPILDKSDAKALIYYPSGNDTAESRFPLISYLHGLAGGGGLDIEGYAVLFAQMASYGFVVAAPLSCNDGCRDQVNAPYTDCAGLPSVQPANWPSYYGEQLKTMEWAHSAGKEGSDPILSLIDWDAGVGIAGHSMGGQATAITASKNCVVQHFGARIKAAVLHHAANGAVGGGPTPGKTNVGTNVSIPTAAFTSSGDSIWAETRDIFDAAHHGAASKLPLLYRDEVGYSHLEPVLAPPIENPYLATFTAAWFKIHLRSGAPGGPGDTWYDMIYGTTPDSLCNSAPMVNCTLVP